MTALEISKEIYYNQEISVLEGAELIKQYAEAYHKAKVEAISKEDIYSKICQFVSDIPSVTRQPLITHRKVSQRSVNWFKEELNK